jgi:hypothetical protein
MAGESIRGTGRIDVRSIRLAAVLRQGPARLE